IYDAPIVILDEATSALDNVSQKKVLNVVKKYCKNKVLLVIAHRLTTVSDADKIYILQKGRNVGVGTHQELLKENEFYRELNLKTENDVEGE
ncbi:MAG: ABC transporter ATP-binding protein, partial [Acetivibrio ethanolgignens]